MLQNDTQKIDDKLYLNCALLLSNNIGQNSLLKHV